MEKPLIGQQIADARKELGITQDELALECNLHIRTIQRIEAGDVKPRLYTLRLLNDVLGTNFGMHKQRTKMEQEVGELRRTFKRRRRIRIVTAFSAIFLMLAVVVIAFPSWKLFGLPKLTWAPFFYLIMFAHIIAIGFYWRCPACNGLLGDLFNTKYCSKCGLKFYD